MTMTIIWTIQYTYGTPPVWIASGGGLTYQLRKAKHYETREAAERRIAILGLADRWGAVAYPT